MGRKRIHTGIPQVNDLYKPLVKSLIDLGGSGNIEEINEKVYDELNLSDEILDVPHGDDGRTEVEYRLAWARTVLKNYGLLENSSRGVWSLTRSHIDLQKINPEEIYRTVRESLKPKKKSEDSLAEKISIDLEAVN